MVGNRTKRQVDLLDENTDIWSLNCLFRLRELDCIPKMTQDLKLYPIPSLDHNSKSGDDLFHPSRCPGVYFNGLLISNFPTITGVFADIQPRGSKPLE